MKIYFAGSIRGGRQDAALYRRIITLLKSHGEVLTEHVGDPDLSTGEQGLSDGAIYRRDMAWIEQSDALIAEVTVPSHGVGYEIARAIALGKPVLCLFRPQSGRSLSALLSGNEELRCESYESVQGLAPVLASFLGCDDHGSRGDS